MDKKSIRELYNLMQSKFSDEIIKEEKYKEIQNRYDIASEILETSLTKDEFSLHEDVLDLYTELLEFEVEEGFVKGFSLSNQLRDDSITR